jgi:iron complex outermembrane receptor protein
MSRAKVRLFQSIVIVGAMTCSPAAAQEPRAAYDLPPQELKYALRSVARGAGFQLIADSSALRGRHSKALKGDYTLQEALDALLAGSDLSVEVRSGTIFVRGRSEPSRAAVASAADDGAIVITGSRIRGARPASPVNSRSREQIERLGFSDLGTFARSLPQNFSGGQNPGVVSSLQTGSENFNSSSTLNLRGLGPDATLTLLNGHRLAYDATTQGIDISAIPLAAIERVEIVADGSSALYGSDAVGGVANIILRRDYSGLQTSARFGAATDGGFAQKQFGLISGARWAGGGFMIAGDFAINSEVRAGQRSYTQRLQPAMTLFPWQRQVSAVVTGHQDLGAGLELEVDGHINEHRSRTTLPFTTTNTAFQAGLLTAPKVLSYSFSPTIKSDIGGNWEGRVSITRAKSESDGDAFIYSGGNLSATNRARYDNGLWSGEVGLEGPLFSLPGGSARMAVGGGIRSVDLVASIQQITAAATRSLLSYTDDRTISFGFGELSLPIFSETNDLALANRLIASLAVRYEHYSGIGGLATPKLGLIWSPVSVLTLKGSWGRSFKAPTLSQENQVMNGSLVNATTYLPAPPDNRPILSLGGGNPDLVSEKATSWTLGAVLEPASVPGLRLELSYFQVRYKNRVTAPITRESQAFTASLYQDLIIHAPTVSQVQAIVAKLPLGVVNQTSSPFDPNNVGAVVNNQIQNVASQDVNGLDVAAAYRFAVGQDRIALDASASYLKSNQRRSANQPKLQVAGMIFNPPHWRGQASVSWERDLVGLTGAATYIGGTTDRRLAKAVEVGDFLSFDASARVTTNGSGLLGNIQLLVSATNLFNRKPAFIAGTGINLNYDAINYPSVGRTVSFTVSKSW